MKEDTDRRTILVVDDTPDNITVLNSVLRLEYDVKATLNGEEALEIAAIHPQPDMILLDIMMPVMDGYEVCRRLKSNPLTAKIPVIFVTAKTQVDEEKKGLELGAVDYIAKPFSPPIVKARISAHLALSAQEKELEKKFTTLSTYDPLTGLYNRTMLVEHVKHAIVVSDNHQRPFGLLYFGLDNFKNINDTWGFAGGDKVLKQVSTRVKRLAGEGNILTRIGADEFVLLAGEIENEAYNMVLADRLLEEVFGLEFVVENKLVQVTSSLGIAIYPGDGSEAEELIRNADTAMYKAKDSGRNRFMCYSSKMHEAALTRLEMEEDISNALLNGEFFLLYQPKIDPHSLRVCGAEALIRWKHPVKGLLSPIQFIPIAEKSDLIIEIGRWVREEVVRQLLSWKNSGFPLLPVSVNVSGKEFSRRVVLPHLIDLFLKHDIEQRYLELEITENTLIESEEMGNKDNEVLQGMGIGLAIDDFGTGYCSLSYLKKYTINTLKIDKSFIDAVTDNERDASITRTIIAMGKSLKMDVVAEGVETKEQVDFLKDNHCGQIQGYYFSRPLPVAEYEHYLRQPIAPHGNH